MSPIFQAEYTSSLLEIHAFQAINMYVNKQMKVFVRSCIIKQINYIQHRHRKSIQVPLVFDMSDVICVSFQCSSITV